MSVSRLFIGLVTLLAIVCSAQAQTQSAPVSTTPAPQELTLAIVPQYPAPQLLRDWGPLAEHLSAEMGIKIVLRLYKSIPDFEAELLKGVPDLAFMNPYHAVMSYRAQGYIPLMRSSKPLTGYLLIRKDAPFKNVTDLADKTVAYPAPNSFAASLYMRALLEGSLHVRTQPRYVTTHSNVIRQLLNELAPAGGVANTAFDREPEAVRDQLRILYRTPSVASHPLGVHPRVPVSLRKIFSAALLKAAQDKVLGAVFAPIGLESPEPANYINDYAPLETLKLEKFVVTEEP